jgi:cytochrome c oxidase cbb3-type subunit 2
MDRLNNILLWAGLGCFALSFLLSGLYPYLITDGKTPEASIRELAEEVSSDFRLLKEAYPVDFARAFPEGANALTDPELATIAADDPRRGQSEEAWKNAYARALRDGRDLYIAEACWHCHSQYVRPVGNEVERFGPVRTTAEDNNALQRPVLWGTRRVGPDLTHEGGKRSNDWHMAHLRNPRSTSPDSVMPAYTWYFRRGFQIRRSVSSETAEREGIPADQSYPYPGLYDTKAEAEAALAKLKASLSSNLEEEAERMFVAEGSGPDGDALALVAYLQWLGTWSPKTTGASK